MPATLSLVFATLASLGFADEPKVIFSDDFSNVGGYYSTNLDGEYENAYNEATRNAHTFLSETIKDGRLQVTLKEDHGTKGFDGKPGVLSFSYDKMPGTADYSGFYYAGTTDKPIQLHLKGTLDAEELKKIKVSFRYKATNKIKEHVGMVLNCRFESDIDNAYESRVDFDKLNATGQWQVFSKTLSEGTNQKGFLSAFNDNKMPAVKLVWGQQGAVTNYQDGDTLLIDDIKITIAE